jgi:hypothetical protein
MTVFETENKEIIKIYEDYQKLKNIIITTKIKLKNIKKNIIMPKNKN